MSLYRRRGAIKRGDTRIETPCGKYGAPNRVTAAPGEARVEFKCEECGQKERVL